jgi:hypothetical protein
MLPAQAVIIGALFNLFGSTSYVIATIKGKARPNKVSWFIWALAPLIAFAAEVQQGVGLRSLMTFMVGFGPLMVFIASFVNKKSQWQIKHLDIFCGILSLIGLLLWFLTRVGNVAIIFSILADGLSSVPTIVKSYQHPETEDNKVYLFSIISSLITLLTIKDWNVQNVGFPLYIFLDCMIIYCLVTFKLGRKLAQK